MAKILKGAAFGTGFWSKYQISGWHEIEGVRITALYNRTPERAHTMANHFGIDACHVYSDPKTLLENEDIDFIDIITNAETHNTLTKLAASYKKDVVCQKPMAASYKEAQDMCESCATAGVKLFINENFRFQAPVRRAKEILESGVLGTVYKAHVDFCSGFPVFENQPFLKEIERFILIDIGTHVLDVSRFLLGEAKTVFCRIKRVNPTIKGEDVANVFMEMESGAHCICEMSYASIVEDEAFPQPTLYIEGDRGSLRLSAHGAIKVTTRKGVIRETVIPTMYDWVDPAYLVTHSSIVDAQRNIAQGLNGGLAETTGDDNLKTLRLVYACYDSLGCGLVKV